MSIFTGSSPYAILEIELLRFDNGYKYEICTARSDYHTEFQCNTVEELFDYLKQLTEDYKKEEMNMDCQHQK